MRMNYSSLRICALIPPLIKLMLGRAEFLRHNNTCIFHKKAKHGKQCSVCDSGDIFSAEHTMHILQLQQCSLRCSGFISVGLAGLHTQKFKKMQKCN